MCKSTLIAMHASRYCEEKFGSRIDYDVWHSDSAIGLQQSTNTFSGRTTSESIHDQLAREKAHDIGRDVSVITTPILAPAIPDEVRVANAGTVSRPAILSNTEALAALEGTLAPIALTSSRDDTFASIAVKKAHRLQAASLMLTAEVSESIQATLAHTVDLIEHVRIGFSVAAHSVGAHRLGDVTAVVECADLDGRDVLLRPLPQHIWESQHCGGCLCIHCRIKSPRDATGTPMPSPRNPPLRIANPDS